MPIAPRVRSLARIGLAVTLAVAMLLPTTASATAQPIGYDSWVGKYLVMPAVEKPDRLEAFRGLATWVDLYDTSLAPAEQARRAHAGGATAIYAQASFARTNGVARPGRLAELIETAHDLDMTVMVWTLPDLVNVAADHARADAAIGFTTPRGDKPDALGIDIEVTTVANTAVRNARLLELLTAIRRSLPDVPVAAIPYPPLQLELNTSLWPDFPWREVAALSDVLMPMSYSSFRGTSADITYSWNLGNVIRIKQLVGPDAQIHLAGGIADRMPHADAFARAVIDSGVLGGSLYDLHTTSPTTWQQMAPVQHVGAR